MAGNIEGPLRRLQRAIEHYLTLKNDHHGGFDRRAHPVTHTASRDGLRYEFWIGEVETPALEWSLLLGEAYYNLRSALDHLVFELHLRRHRGRVPKSVEGRSQFPIYSKPPIGKGGAPTVTNQWPDIGTLGAKERRTLAFLQPYRGSDPWDKPGHGTRSQRNALGDIARINNLDKHRELHGVHSWMYRLVRPEFDGRFGFRQEPMFGTEITSGSLVDTWTFDQRPPIEAIERHGPVWMSVGIYLDGDRVEVLPNLGGSILGVAGILQRFADRFPSPSLQVNLGPVHLTEGPGTT